MRFRQCEIGQCDDCPYEKLIEDELAVCDHWCHYNRSHDRAIVPDPPPPLTHKFAIPDYPPDDLEMSTA